MTVMRLDNRFQLTLLFGEFVKIRIRIGVQRVHFIQTGQGIFHFRNRFFNRFTDSVFRIQFRFLRQIADVQAGLRTCFALNIGIHTCHDAQQG